MDSSNLKEHLDLLKMKDIKNLIRQYNLHYKIKLSQNKPDLISDLLKHFEEYTINDNNITLKSKQYDFIKIDEPKPKAPRKPKIKKDKREDVKEVVKEVAKEIVKEVKIKQPEDDFDTISHKLQQLIIATPIKDIGKALLKLNFKGRMQTNKILLNMQLLQNFNTIEKMKSLINSLNIKNN